MLHLAIRIRLPNTGRNPISTSSMFTIESTTICLHSLNTTDWISKPVKIE